MVTANYRLALFVINARGSAGAFTCTKYHFAHNFVFDKDTRGYTCEKALSSDIVIVTSVYVHESIRYILSGFSPFENTKIVTKCSRSI